MGVFLEKKGISPEIEYGSPVMLYGSVLDLVFLVSATISSISMLRDNSVTDIPSGSVLELVRVGCEESVLLVITIFMLFVLLRNYINITFITNNYFVETFCGFAEAI